MGSLPIPRPAKKKKKILEKLPFLGKEILEKLPFFTKNAGS